ncbi:MAG: signal peptide peptidase SppA [Oscillospiraceae bacterium]|nr:signal peptide peptidase SppA [Oscillospiraceae bacterium]
MNSRNIKRNILISAASITVCIVLLFAIGIAKFNDTDVKTAEKPEKSFAVINVIGTIQSGNEGSARVGYDHNATIKYIDQLIEDETNTGIFLDVDSGGGTVYESDETYLKLMEYKEKTGRPIHAYFNGTACSGAYYISCAADYISQNRNGWTGSIGVIISTTNLSGLYEKLGIQEVLIVSGGNKGMGSAGSEMTDEHIAIYQSLVDEAYDQFVGIVAQGRNLTEERTREIADGRVYSALQAKEIDLIDEVQSYEDAVAYMEEVTGSEKYYKPLYTPTKWEKLMADIEAVMPKSDMQMAAEIAAKSHSGVPMYMVAE